MCVCVCVCVCGVCVCGVCVCGVCDHLCVFACVVGVWVSDLLLAFTLSFHRINKGCYCHLPSRPSQSSVCKQVTHYHKHRGMHL